MESPRHMEVSVGPRTEICGNPASPFAIVPCLHQSNVCIKKKATHMESPKMYSSSRFKILTYLCGTANDPVSCKPV